MKHSGLYVSCPQQSVVTVIAVLVAGAGGSDLLDFFHLGFGGLTSFYPY